MELQGLEPEVVRGQLSVVHCSKSLSLGEVALCFGSLSLVIASRLTGARAGAGCYWSLKRPVHR